MWPLFSCWEFHFEIITKSLFASLDLFYLDQVKPNKNKYWFGLLSTRVPCEDIKKLINIKQLQILIFFGLASFGSVRFLGSVWFFFSSVRISLIYFQISKQMIGSVRFEFLRVELDRKIGSVSVNRMALVILSYSVTT